MSDAQNLYNLQQNDLALAALKAKLKSLDNFSNAQDLKAHQQELHIKETKVVGLKKDQEITKQDLEEKLQSLTERKDEAQEKLEKETNHRAVQDLQARFSELAKQIEKTEFALNNTAADLEKSNKALSILHKQQEASASASDANKADLKEQLMAMQQEARALMQKRQEISNRLPAELLEQYKALFVRFKGVPVETLLGDKPSGCRISLQSADYSEIIRCEDDIVRCPYCKRLLVKNVEVKD